MDSEVYKIRSFSSCMKAAYDMFSTNIKTIFRRTWLAALLFAAISAVAVIASCRIAFVPAVPSTATVVVFLAFSLLAVAAAVWFNTIIISLINGASVKSNLPRVIKLTVLILVISWIVWALAMVQSFVHLIQGHATLQALSYSTLSFYGIMTVYLLALIPVLYSSMKYLIEHETKLPSVFGKSYIIGLRHWGYLFMLCFLTGIIMTIIYIIVSIPLSVAIMASVMDNAGMMMGDSSGLPGYFMLLMGSAAMVSSFIMLYAGAWFTMIVYYAYGHIEAKEKARKAGNAAVVVAETEAATDKEQDFEEIR